MDDEQNDVLELDTLADAEIETPEIDADDGDISIEIEGEEAAPDETPLQKNLREEIRKRDKEIAELRKGAAPAAQIVAGKKPDLWEDCEGDPDRYEADLLKWHEANRAVEQQQQAQQQKSQVTAQAFERAQIEYRAKAQTVGIRNFESAEATVKDALGSDYLGAIVQYADDPVKLVAALGTHPALLSKITDEPDPMRRLKMLFQMESKVKITRKAPPAPEADTIVRGSAQLSAASVDKVGDQIYKQCERTGDFSAYYAHQRQLRKK